MARVTRSKKVEIAEDNTAQALGFETLPLPQTGSQIQPFADIAGNTMPDMDAEIKNLKGAWKMAVGVEAETGTGIGIGIVKRGKKGKNKKKAKDQQESEDGHIIENNGVLVRADMQEMSEEDNRTLVVGSSAEQPKLTKPAIKATLEIVEQPAQPAARTTRRQAKAKEAEEELRKSSRLATRKETGGALLPEYGSVLSQEECKDSQEKAHAPKATKETPDAQIPEIAILLQAESKDLEENVKSLQIAQGPANSITEPEADGDNDSFVEQIRCRSPAKAVSRIRDSLEFRIRPSQSPEKKSTTNLTNGTAAKQADDSDSDSDSFVEQISSRSPAKPVSRIEDSVEALDQMEEVEEALHEAAMAERMVSPEKTRQKPKQRPANPSAPVGAKVTRGHAGTKQQPDKPGYSSMRVKPTAAKHTSIIKKATSMTFKPSDSSETSSIREEVNKSVPLTKKTSVKRPTSLLPPKEPVKSTKPVTRPTNFELPGEAVARKLKEQREARLAQRTESSEDTLYTAPSRQCSGPNIKSTKPLTKPAFELPGEALSRRKREAHEAKLKAQEEEERKRREFKAKPVRKSMISTIRDTVASRARQSKIGIESIADGNLSVSKRGSNVGAHRPSIQELCSMANTSAPRAPAPAPLERKPSTKFHGPSMSGLAMQRTVSASDVQVQRQRAKEIYNRDQKLAEDIERERREREAAAKRSREEAAERGRQASREWAAKQLAKKMAEGDKGMSAGYGPGGQMGLKA